MLAFTKRNSLSHRTNNKEIGRTGKIAPVQRIKQQILIKLFARKKEPLNMGKILEYQILEINTFIKIQYQ